MTDNVCTKSILCKECEELRISPIGLPRCNRYAEDLRESNYCKREAVKCYKCITKEKI